jgi:hypothetical protein
VQKTFVRLAIATIALTLPHLAAAQDRGGQVEAFGGLTVRGASVDPLFGGNVAVPLGDRVQIVGEGGWLNDILSPTLSTLIDFTPVDLRLSAAYGQAGVRLIGPSDRALRPYAEFSAGFARLAFRFSGAGSRTDAGINTALQFLEGTKPVFGMGAGVIVQGGPVVLDLGYRFQQFRQGNALETFLAGGNLNVNQVRVGVGVRF